MSATLATVAAGLGPVLATASGAPTLELRGPDVRLDDVAHDSRHDGTSWLFCAVRGARVDGHDLVDDAVAHGSVAALVDRWVDLPLPQLRVDDVRRAIGPAASIVHGHPSRDLTVVGVTGTNGKTTVVTLLEAAFGADARGTGTIGTLGARIHGAPLPGQRTTPEGSDLQRLLREMRVRGVDAVAMEVSSHGLALHRVDGTTFAVAVFTNLTQDHLDFHGSMDAYLEAKARLFTPGLASRAVVDLDGARARDLIARATIPVTTVGTADDADHRLVDLRVGSDGGAATVLGPGGAVELRTRLLGRFNVHNAATALVAAMVAGVPGPVAAAGIARAAAPAGRLEPVGRRDGAPLVLVDYAHTPDALTVMLAAVRELVGPDARLHLVVGAGGDRDRDKRRPMGRAAGRADTVTVTDDNPRSEDPDAIVASLIDGLEDARSLDGLDPLVRVERDRAAAIGRAIAAADPGDVVVVAGKGHETGQEAGGRVRPFDDREVAARALAVRP